MLDVLIGFLGVMAIWFIGYCFLAPKDIYNLIRKMVGK